MNGLSVKAAAKLAGLTPHTLRAWERRYGLVQPSRAQSGRRLYSMDDVKKLQILSGLTEAGYSIGGLSKLNIKELVALLKTDKSAERLPVKNKFQEGKDEFFELQRSLLSLALRRLDFEGVQRLILQARHSTSVRSFVLEIASPLFAEVGVLVAQGVLDIVQEHALSAIMRTHLGDLLFQVQKTTLSHSQNGQEFPRLIFSTPEGDLHEFGILLAAILAGTRGFKFYYLGPNMPPESLAKAALAAEVQVVVIGSVEAAEGRLVRPVSKYIQILTNKLSEVGGRDVSIWIGGQCNFDITVFGDHQKIIHTRSLTDFDQRLELLAGQCI